MPLYCSTNYVAWHELFPTRNSTNLMRYWLLKTEPSTFSIDDLRLKGKAPWDGVRNYQARNMMRDYMHVGDRVFIYHSGKEPCIVGEGEVASTSYPDPTQFKRMSPYYDPRATKEKPIWFLVDVRFTKKYRAPMHLKELRTVGALRGMALLKRGSRLSVQPVRCREWESIQRVVKN